MGNDDKGAASHTSAANASNCSLQDISDASVLDKVEGTKFDLTPTIKAVDDGAAAHTIDPTSKRNRAMRKDHFRLKIR